MKGQIATQIIKESLKIVRKREKNEIKTDNDAAKQMVKCIEELVREDSNDTK